MARRIPASLTRAYNNAIKRQGATAEKAVKSALKDYMRENPDASVEELREVAIELMTAAGDLYGNACSQAAFDLQDEIAKEFGTKPPDLGGWLYEPDAESISRTAHYQVEKLKKGDKEGFVDEIAAAARYYAERGANSTMAQTARKQASSGGKSGRKGATTHGVLFARVPSGPTTCPFCLMLASRGFVYLSKESAGEFDQFHRHCDCRIVPGYPGMELEGYDPDEYYDRWKNPEKYENPTEEASLNHGRWKSDNREKREHAISIAIGSVDPVFISPRGNERLIRNIRRIKHVQGQYDIHAHGKPGYVTIFGHKMDAEALAFIIKSRSDYHGEPIRLFACHGGESDGDGACVAQQLADILKVVVYGAPDVATIRDDGSFYFGNPDIKDLVPFKPQDGNDDDLRNT